MCEDCFEKNMMGFPSQEDFDHFTQILDEKIKTKKMKFNPLTENVINVLDIDYRIYATCNSCNENWFLEIPNNANRGYFLNNHGLEIYSTERNKQNQRVRRNGLILLVLIVVVTIYKCTQ
jgi:hypothetical protein